MTNGSTKIVVLFNLKPGVSAVQYEDWARRRDLPTVRSLQSIDEFEVFRATGLLTGGESPYAYIEIIDVTDMAQFGDDIARDPMPAIAAEFRELADAIFIATDRL